MMACPLCGRTMVEGSRELPDGRVVLACSSGHSTAAVATERTKLAHREDAELLAALEAEVAAPSAGYPDYHHAPPSAENERIGRSDPLHREAEGWQGCKACGTTRRAAPGPCEQCGHTGLTLPRMTEDEVNAELEAHWARL